MASCLALIASLDCAFIIYQVKPFLVFLKPIPVSGDTMGIGTRYGKGSRSARLIWLRPTKDLRHCCSDGVLRCLPDLFLHMLSCHPNIHPALAQLQGYPSAR